jgi:hypothetical protein
VFESHWKGCTLFFCHKLLSCIKYSGDRTVGSEPCRDHLSKVSRMYDPPCIRTFQMSGSILSVCYTLICRFVLFMCQCRHVLIAVGRVCRSGSALLQWWAAMPG